MCLSTASAIRTNLMDSWVSSDAVVFALCDVVEKWSDIKKALVSIHKRTHNYPVMAAACAWNPWKFSSWKLHYVSLNNTARPNSRVSLNFPASARCCCCDNCKPHTMVGRCGGHHNSIGTDPEVADLWIDLLYAIARWISSYFLFAITNDLSSFGR